MDCLIVARQSRNDSAPPDAAANALITFTLLNSILEPIALMTPPPPSVAREFFIAVLLTVSVVASALSQPPP